MKCYYNEWDPFAAAWLRELIAARVIPAGDVDTRSICEVRGDDLAGYDQVHFFAGIGGWAYALQRAGWPADRPVWTGSCPCQPFSSAGKRQGEADDRHLWPEFRRLLTERRPAVVFGEQVASRLGRAWLAGVQADLEGMGYAVAGADLCAAGVGAPHIRQRLYWVADADDVGRRPGHGEARGAGRQVGVRARALAGNSGTVGGLADTPDARVGRAPAAVTAGDGSDVGISGAHSGSGGDGLGDARISRRQELRRYGEFGLQHPAGGRWFDHWLASYQWILCRDGKQRRIPLESELFPLAHGVPNRVGTLRGAGNAIVPEVAVAFIEAYLTV